MCFVFLATMAANEDLSKFLVWFIEDISNELKRSMQDMDQGFTNYLANLSSANSTDEVSWVLGVFEDGPSKSRGLIKSIKEYVLLAGGVAKQTKMLAYQTSQGAVIDYTDYITENNDSTQEQLKSELSVMFVKVCDPHHALSLFCKAKESKSAT